MKFSIQDFFNKCDQIRSFLWISSHLLKKSLIENFIFCAVLILTFICPKQIENNMKRQAKVESLAMTLLDLVIQQTNRIVNFSIFMMK